ncbi:hypothetical protein QUF63_05270 [Anaerolineales bacterium HSG25]|nr:hypothetical protein [Anaerolineales bacterium HSG25]
MNDQQPSLTRQDLDQLQHLRASVVAFQTMIAPLPASHKDDNHNEQFNQLRLEVQARLKDPNFDKKISSATTETLVRQGRSGRLSYLWGVVILGVILALFGLGFNSLFSDSLSLAFGCLTSLMGMFLVMGALVAWSMSNLSRSKTSNMGDIYQRCDSLRYQIEHTLTMAIPELSDTFSTSEIPNIPSVLELALDSLNKQAADWQQKRQALYDQEARLSPNTPTELMLNIDFVERRLSQVKTEIARLQGEGQTGTGGDSVVPVMDGAPGGVQEIPLPGGRKIAVAKVGEKLESIPVPPADAPATGEAAIDTREMKRIAKVKAESDADATDLPTDNADDTSETSKTPEPDITDTETLEDEIDQIIDLGELSAMPDPKPSTDSDEALHRANTIGMPLNPVQTEETTSSESEASTDDPATSKI